MHQENLPAAQALEKLREGNARFLAENAYTGDVSAAVRTETARNGQTPYAIVITCSDSRVIPEALFSASVGELFVIRVAGNVIGNHELGSIEYATDHLGTNLVVVLGHTHCGAVGATLHGQSDGYIKTLTDEIRIAIGDETDETRACIANVKRGVSIIRRSLPLPERVRVIGALYDIENGSVDFSV